MQQFLKEYHSKKPLLTVDEMKIFKDKLKIEFIGRHSTKTYGRKWIGVRKILNNGVPCTVVNGSDKRDYVLVLLNGEEFREVSLSSFKVGYIRYKTNQYDTKHRSYRIYKKYSPTKPFEEFAKWYDDNKVKGLVYLHPYQFVPRWYKGLINRPEVRKTTGGWCGRIQIRGEIVFDVARLCRHEAQELYSKERERILNDFQMGW